MAPRVWHNCRNACDEATLWGIPLTPQTFVYRSRYQCFGNQIPRLLGQRDVFRKKIDAKEETYFIVAVVRRSARLFGLLDTFNKSLILWVFPSDKYTHCGKSHALAKHGTLQYAVLSYTAAVIRCLVPSCLCLQLVVTGVTMRHL